MATIMDTLFGVSTERFQQERDAAADAQAMQYARLSPIEKASFGVQRGAYGLAGALGGALGAKDPELARNTMRQQIAGQINFADPKSIFQGVDLLRQSNDPQGAMMLADVGRKAESERALAQQRTAEKMTPEERNAMAYARSVAEPGTPQYNSIYQTTLQGLISKEKPPATTNEITNASRIALTAGPEGSPEYIAKFNTELERLTTKPELRPVIKEIGVARTPGQEAVYTYQVGNGAPQQIIYKTVNGQQTIVPYSGGVDRTTATSKTEVKMPESESEFIKQLAKEDAQELTKARGTSRAAADELKSLQKLQELNQQDLVSGSFATNRVGVLNFFNTLGMASGKDIKTLANSEQYSKVTGDLLLDKIKKLGTQPSSTDREFIAKILPQLENSSVARQELINYLANRANQVVSEVRDMDIYARKNRGLGGYVPTIPLVGQTLSVSTMSTEQLQRIARGQQP